MIRQKTASLIAACCATGARSAGVDELTVSKMKKFGENVGMAFRSRTIFSIMVQVTTLENLPVLTSRNGK